MLRAYLLSPFPVHRRRSLPDIYRNLGMSVDDTFGRVLAGLVTLVSSLITVVGIAVVMLIVSPLATAVAIAMFALATVGLQALLKSRQLAIGERVAAAVSLHGRSSRRAWRASATPASRASPARTSSGTAQRRPRGRSPPAPSRF